MPLVQKPFGDIITFTRASTATYFDSTGVLQSAAIDAPRLDYDPATLLPRGLLVEEQRTNLFPASNDFANATYWTAYGTAVATAGSGIGPDGLNSAVNLVGATDTTISGNNIEESITVSASTAYEFSVFVKSNGGTTVTLRLRDSTGGSTSSTAFTVTSTWTRISLNRTMAAGATSVRCIIGLTDGNIFIYGAQLEAGAFPTSYIPTTTTALTRSADVASVNTLSPWFNGTEGAVYVEWDMYSFNAGLNYRATLDDGTSNNSLRMRLAPSGTTAARHDVVNSGVATTLGSPATINLALTKEAMAFAANDYAGVINGGAAVTSSTLTLPTPTRLSLGSRESNSSFLNGHLRRVTYYPRRLSNAELVSVTS